MWVAPTQQSTVYPTTISQEGQGRSRFARDFSYQGTDDPTAWLAMAAALDLRAAVPGGEAALLEYIWSLAEQGGALLAKLWGTERLSPSAGVPWRGCMVNVRLPTDNATAALAVSDVLRLEHRTWVPCFAGEPKGLPASTYWCRISAFIYNDLDDFRMLGEAVRQILGLALTDRAQQRALTPRHTD